MQAIFRKENGTLPFAVASDGTALVAGEVVVINGALAGITPTAISKGERGTLQRKGVFECACPAVHDAIAVGAPMYFDESEDNFTVTATGNIYAGMCCAAALANSTTVYIDIDADLSALMVAAAVAFAAHT